MPGDPLSMGLPPEGCPAGDLPYGLDTIRMRISWPDAPASRGYNGRMWRMRPLRGWTGAARQDAPGADEGTGDRDGSAVTGSGHARPFPEQGQAVPADQAAEGGGPASELLAAFRALRAGAPQGRGPTAKEAGAGLASAPEQQSLVEGAGFSNNPIRNGTGTASDAVAPDTAGRDGNGPGSAPPITIAASLPLSGRSTNAPASGDAGSTTVGLGTVTTAQQPGTASSPAGSVTSDGANNTINGDFIRHREGFTTSGYVPKKDGDVQGQSGVTVGNGVDLGAQSAEKLRALGVDEDTIKTLSPYFGKKKQDAIDALKAQPLSLSQQQAIDPSNRLLKSSAEEVATNLTAVKTSLVLLICSAIPKPCSWTSIISMATSYSDISFGVR